MLFDVILLLFYAEEMTNGRQELLIATLLLLDALL